MSISYFEIYVIRDITHKYYVNQDLVDTIMPSAVLER